MKKKKVGAELFIADGADGMRLVDGPHDDAGPWPIELTIPPTDAESWMKHLAAEAEHRNWVMSQHARLDATANDGSVTIHSGVGQSPPSLEIIWERRRGQALQIKARTGGNPPLEIGIARDILDAVATRLRLKTNLRVHHRALLTYHGLPWLGELWLSPDIRVGPASKRPDTLLGPQNVVVDLMVEGIGSLDAYAQLGRRTQEIRIFLGTITGINFTPAKLEYGWVTDVDGTGKYAESSLRPLGYVESSLPTGFPTTGAAPPVARRKLVRPDTGPEYIDFGMHEQWLPADIEGLWLQFAQLQAARKEQFLQAGNAYLIAQSFRTEQRTAFTAFLVIATESLKPSDPQFDDLNMYDVVASLLAHSAAASLQAQHKLHPQKVRNNHLHRGKLEANELLPLVMNNIFADPSFDEMLRILAKTTRMCLIEWLRRNGSYAVTRFRVAQRSARAVTTSRASKKTSR